MNWGQSIFLFFIVFIALAVTFIIFSLNINNDLVSENYYDKGANYTNQMEIDLRSKIYEDSIGFKYKNDSVFIDLPNSLKKIDSLFVYFYNPSNKIFDNNIVFKVDSNINLKSGLILSKGRYIISFQWRFFNDNYEINKTVFIK